MVAVRKRTTKSCYEVLAAIILSVQLEKGREEFPEEEKWVRPKIFLWREHEGARAGGGTLVVYA